MKKKAVFCVIALAVLTTTACNQNVETKTKNNGVEINNQEKELSKETAFLLEDEFLERLFPERTEEGLVKSFKTKDQLMDQVTKVADREISKRYIDTYYEEINGLLYIRATEGPLTIEKDKPFEFKKISDVEYEIIQDGEDTLRGEYRFTVKFIKRDKDWIIKNRIYESR